MGIVIRVPNASFSEATSRVLLPVRSGLIAESYFGGTMARSVINHAAGGTSLTPTGSIQINDNDAFFPDGLARLETDIVSEPQYPTIFFVGRRVDDDLPCSFISNVQAATNETSTGIVQAGSTGADLGFRARDENGASNNLARINGYPATSDAIISMVVSPISGGFRTTGRATNSSVTEEDVEDFAVNRGAGIVGQPFGVGVDVGVGYNGSFYAKSIAIFDRPLSSAEILEVEEFYKKWLL